VKKSKSAGESACATSASPALAMVGQAFSLPRPLAGAFFLQLLTLTARLRKQNARKPGIPERAF